MCQSKSIPVKFVAQQQLDLLSEGRPNQSLVMCCSPLKLEKVTGLGFVGSDGKYPIQQSASELGSISPVQDIPIWIALDQVVDPQNFGAIIRTAHFLGVDGIVVTESETAPLSPAVSKASGGSLEIFASLYVTNNLAKFLASCEGWRIIGTDIHSPDKLDGLDAATEPTILVIGNEGKGLRPVVSRACHSHAVIQGKCTDGIVDSLNVSAATAYTFTNNP